jgi:hypothetical protein
LHRFAGEDGLAPRRRPRKCPGIMSIRPRLLLACALLASVAALTASADPTVNKDGHFSTDFPGAVTISSQPAGNSVLNIVNYDQDNTTSFFVMYGDQPAGTWARLGGIDRAYQLAINGAMKSQNGTLLSSGDCQTGNTAGKEYLVDIPDKKLVCRVRYYIVGNRLFQVMYVGQPGTQNDKRVTDFLDSFRLLDQG